MWHEVIVKKKYGLKLSKLLILPFFWPIFGIGFYMTLNQDMIVLEHYDSMKIGNLSIINWKNERERGETSYYGGELIEKKEKAEIQVMYLFETKIDFTSYDPKKKPSVPIDTIPIYYSEKHDNLIARNYTTSQKSFLDTRILLCKIGIFMCLSLFYWPFHHKIWNLKNIV
jgi:hypothetical protein